MTVAGPQSTVWTQLASPLFPAKCVPYVSDDNVTIFVDPGNFQYVDTDHPSTGDANSVPGQLTIKGGLRVGSADLSAVPSPTYTINEVSGRVILQAARTFITVTNNKMVPGAFVFLQQETQDAAITLLTVSGINGSFTITANAAPSVNVRILFFIVNTLP